MGFKQSSYVQELEAQQYCTHPHRPLSCRSQPRLTHAVPCSAMPCLGCCRKQSRCPGASQSGVFTHQPSVRAPSLSSKRFLPTAHPSSSRHCFTPRLRRRRLTRDSKDCGAARPWLLCPMTPLFASQHTNQVERRLEWSGVMAPKVSLCDCIRDMLLFPHCFFPIAASLYNYYYTS